MGRWKSNKVGFTLIELLVVVIIVAILAAVGVPLLAGNVERAKGSEAEAGLGTIRTAMRSFLAEHGSYSGASMSSIGLNRRADGDAVGDLDGHFYSEEAYSVTVGPSPFITFCAVATGSASVNPPAPKEAEVNGAGFNRAMNVQGTIFNNNACS